MTIVLKTAVVFKMVVVVAALGTCPTTKPCCFNLFTASPSCPPVHKPSMK